MPAALRLAERVRGDPRPRRRPLPDGPGRGRGARRPPLPAGDDGARDELGRPRRLARGARRPADRAVAPRGGALEHAPPLPDRLRRRSRLPADGALRERRGAGQRALRAVLRLRAGARALGVRRSGLPRGGGDRRGDRDDAAADDRHADRLRGTAGHGPDAAQGGRDPLRRAVLVGAPRAEDLRRRLRPARLDGAPLAALARPRRVPRPSLAHLPAAQRAHPEGPVVRAHRGAGGGGDDIAPRDAGRRAELGLPLHLAAGRDVHAVGPVHARLRVGGERLLLLRRGRRRGRSRAAADHVRDRRRVAASGADARPPLGVRGGTAGARRQRGLRPAPARRVGRDPGLRLPAHEVARPPARPLLAAAGGAGRGGAAALEGARPRHLGGARRPEALHDARS